MSSNVCHRYKNLEGQYPRRGTLLLSPGGKRVGLALGAERCLELFDLGRRKDITLITDPLILHPHWGCRDQLNLTPFPLPSRSTPFFDPFSFYPEFTWIKMLWEIEPRDFLHPKSIRNGQTWLIRQKYNDVWKSVEKRNCRQMTDLWFSSGN